MTKLFKEFINSFNNASFHGLRRDIATSKRVYSFDASEFALEGIKRELAKFAPEKVKTIRRVYRGGVTFFIDASWIGYHYEDTKQALIKATN